MARRVTIVTFIVAMGLSLGIAEAGRASRALAAGPCSTSGATTTCAYTGTGEYQFGVPSTVKTLHIVAIGGQGGADYNGSTGALGAQVTADLAVPSGVTALSIEVGGNGQQATDAGAPGGANGGGSGSQTGGGGGGASDVRLCPSADSGPASCVTCPSTISCDSPHSRLVVAGGGGGAAYAGVAGGAAGNSDGSGNAGASCVANDGTGGGGGTTSGPGAFGTGANGGGSGAAGTIGSGGSATSLSWAAGGGGGYYGGGSGGDNKTGHQCGGGGGAGSSYIAPGGSGTIIAASSGSSPKVSISYSVLYVDGNPADGGNNSNDCASSASPCQTIGGAMAKGAPSGSVPAKNILIAGAKGPYSGVYCEQLAIDQPLTIEALNASAPPAIDGGAALPVGQANPCASAPYNETPGQPVVTVGARMVVSLTGLTIQHGDGSSNVVRSVGSTSNSIGGGIYNLGTLTMTSSTVSGNTACLLQCGHAGSYDGGFGGGIHNSGTMTLADSMVSGNAACSTTCFSGEGGGIYSNGTMTVINSTVSGNNTCGGYCGANFTYGYGGGIDTEHPITLTNSTVAGNTACGARTCVGYGGGIWSADTVMLTNSTVSGNMACSSTCSTGYGGGIANSGPQTSMTNSILAGNTATTYPDCYGGFADGNPFGTGTVGNNVIGINWSTDCSLPASSGDQVGTKSNPIDPKLGPLQDNGGPAAGGPLTMAPLLGSPVVNRGNAAVCASANVVVSNSTVLGPNNLDQRGSVRHATIRGTCDVGAVDFGGPPAAPSNLTATPGNGQVTLTWQPPPPSGGTDPYYGVSWTCTASCPSSGAAPRSETVQPQLSTSQTFSWTVTGLTNGATYRFTVTALNIDGIGPGATIGATPGAPTAARVAAFSIRRHGGVVTLHWRVLHATGIAGFNVYATHSGGRLRKLNPRLIRIHSSMVYSYVTSQRGQGGFELQVILAGGGQVAVRTAG